MEDLVPVKKLPGCNLPWASGPKPTCADETPLDISAFMGIETQSYEATAADTHLLTKVNVLSLTSNVWQSIGCVSEQTFDDNKSLWEDHNDVCCCVYVD